VTRDEINWIRASLEWRAMERLNRMLFSGGRCTDRITAEREAVAVVRTLVLEWTAEGRLPPTLDWKTEMTVSPDGEISIRFPEID